MHRHSGDNLLALQASRLPITLIFVVVVVVVVVLFVCFCG